MSGQAAELRKLEMERRLGITPEVKRYNEIKAGVIVSSCRRRVSIFLHFLMQRLRSGTSTMRKSDHASGSQDHSVHGWLALIINGMVVSKKIVEAIEREQTEKHGVGRRHAATRLARGGHE